MGHCVAVGDLGSKFKALKGWVPGILSAVSLAIALAYAGTEGVINALGGLSWKTVLVAFGVVIVRECGVAVGRWWSLIAMFSRKVPFIGLMRTYVEYAAMKVLLPFKLGDAMLVVALRQTYGLPAVVGATTRLFAMALQLGILLSAGIGLYVTTIAGWTLGALSGLAVAGVGSIVGLFLLHFVGRKRFADEDIATDSYPVLLGVLAVAAALGTGLLDGVLYGVAWPGEAGSVGAREMMAIAATVIGCALPLSSRGIGARELLLGALGGQWGLASPSALVAAGLTVSAVEITFVVVAAAVSAALRLTIGGPKPTVEPKEDPESAS